jgi:hypothetical protein
MSKTKTQPKASASAEDAQAQDFGTPKHESQQVTVIEAPMALTFPETMTEAEYFDFGRRMGDALQGASWRVGDYANFGKAKFGIKDYTRLADETGLDEVYIRQCSSVAERVPAEHRALASLERFRVLLPKREKIVRDGKTAGQEEIPVLIARFADWTARELRAGKKDEPKQLSAADTGSPATAGGEDAANAEAGQKPTTESAPADAALKAATADKIEGEMTATAVFECARKLQIGIELLTPDRLALLSVMEQKFPVLKPLGAMVKLLVEQIRTELNKA